MRADVTKSVDAEIADLVSSTYHDPLKFVLACYPWGEPGPLVDHPGPDTWQVEFLTALGEEVKARSFNGSTPVAPVRMAVSKGHGVGGSTLLAWLVDWIMSTRPHCQGTVTANTVTQLETKTWAAVQRWTKLCLTGHWFTVNSARMYHPAFKASWFCTPQTCREENSEAFAGQHAADSTSFYIFDEDSAVPEIIHQVSEGGLTDGEPMAFRFGNATRNTGSFYESVFGRMRDRWRSVIVDSRSSRFANKSLIEEWIKDYGEDSDFVRVRVRGLPPSASDAQFIDAGRVYNAQKRDVQGLHDDPLIAGVDVSGGGSAWTVVRFRRGLDGRSIAPIRITGEASRDRSTVVARLAERLAETSRAGRIAAMFIDTAFGAPIAERLRALGFGDRVHEVNFGGESTSQYQANKRAEMWFKLKDWLNTGAIPRDDTRLESDLTAPGFHLDKKDRLVLESKDSLQKRGVASPDDGDALALTFAQPVAVSQGDYEPEYQPTSEWS